MILIVLVLLPFEGRVENYVECIDVHCWSDYFGTHRLDSTFDPTRPSCTQQTIIDVCEIVCNFVAAWWTLVEALVLLLEQHFTRHASQTLVIRAWKAIGEFLLADWALRVQRFEIMVSAFALIAHISVIWYAMGAAHRPSRVIPMTLWTTRLALECFQWGKKKTK